MLPLNWLQDSRYTVNKEYSGYSEKRYVLRFCGEFVGYCNTKEKAGLSEIVVPESRLAKIK